MRRGKDELKSAAQAGIVLGYTNFQHFADYETQDSRNCEANGCSASGICRCGVITSKRIISTRDVSTACLKLQTRLTDGKLGKPYTPTAIENYFLQRLMVSHGCFSLDGYDIEISGGYYGEEVSGVELKAYSELAVDVFDLLALPTDHAKVMFILNLEYGYIADIIKDTDHVELVNYKLQQVVPSSGAMMLKRQKDYLYPLKDDSVAGITLGGLLIDGNHRVSFLLGEKGPEHSCVFLALSKHRDSDASVSEEASCQ